MFLLDSEDSTTSSIAQKISLNNQKAGLPKNEETKQKILNTIKCATLRSPQTLSTYFQSRKKKKELRLLRLRSKSATPSILSNAESLANDYLNKNYFVSKRGIWFHIDMDMFYCSVAQKLNPELKDKAFVVGRSIVASANYLARKMGIRSAMPVFVAKELAKEVGKTDLIVVRENWKEQSAIAKEVRKIVSRYSDGYFSLGEDEYSFNVEKYLGIDFNHSSCEKVNNTANININKNNRIRNEISKIVNELIQTFSNFPKKVFDPINPRSDIPLFLRTKLIHLVSKIRSEIYCKTSTTASVGVSYNKLLAKIAADLNKPDSYSILLSPKEMSSLKKLEIRKIPGIGKATEEKLRILDIKTLGEMESNRGLIYHLFRGFWRSSLLLFSAGCEFFNNRNKVCFGEVSSTKKFGNHSNILSKGTNDIKEINDRNLNCPVYSDNDVNKRKLNNSSFTGRNSVHIKSIGRSSTFEKTGDLKTILTIAGSLCSSVYKEMEKSSIGFYLLNVSIQSKNLVKIKKSQRFSFLVCEEIFLVKKCFE